MKSIHNMNIFNTSPEEVIKIILQFKEEIGRVGKKTNDYSGLQASFANELYFDGGVVKIRKKDNQAKVKRT